MKSQSMMYVDKIIEIYTADNSLRQVHLFEKLDANGGIHYGCRYFDQKHIFQFDEFYPNKSQNEVIKIAKDWIAEHVSEEMILEWERP